MAERIKTIGKLPVYKGDWVFGTYSKLNQVTYKGSTFQSTIDNNTNVPATLNSDKELIPSTGWVFIAKGVSEEKISEMDKTYATKVELSNEMSGVVKDYKGITCPIDIALNSDVKSISFYLKKKYTTATGYAIKLSSDPSIWNRLGIVNDTNRIVVRGSTTEDFYQLFDNEMPTHIAVVQKDITTCSVYMNGVYVKDVIMTINCIKTIGDDINYYFKLFQIHTFNYTLTQSDVDMLYNQGRCNDVKLGSEWKQNMSMITNQIAWNPNNWSLLNIDDFKRCTQKDNATTYYGGCSILSLSPENRNIPLKVSFSIRSVGSLQQVFVRSDNGKEKNIPVNITSDFVNHSVVWMSDNSGNMLAVGLTGDIGSGNGFDIKDIVVENAQLLDEFLPENLSPTEWKNTGLNTTPIALTNPQFTFDVPFKEKTFGNGAPTAIPEAALIEYSDVATGNIYKAGAKPNTRQFLVSDWKRINN